MYILRLGLMHHSTHISISFMTTWGTGRWGLRHLVLLSVKTRSDPVSSNFSQYSVTVNDVDGHVTVSC